MFFSVNDAVRDLLWLSSSQKRNKAHSHNVSFSSNRPLSHSLKVTAQRFSRRFALFSLSPLPFPAPFNGEMSASPLK